MSVDPASCPLRQVPWSSLATLADLGLSVVQIARYFDLDPSEVRNRMPRPCATKREPALK